MPFAVPCVRSRFSSPIPPYSIVPKGTLQSNLPFFSQLADHAPPSCRHRDAAAPTSNSYYATFGNPVKMSSSYDCTDPSDSKLPTYVPALQPTPCTIPDGRIPAKLHDGKSDLDPTEWKPAERRLAEGKSPTKIGEWKPKLTHRPSSEASSYLSKFHTSGDSFASKRRPMVGPSRTTVSSRSIPGLSHTPTASTSSEESLTGTPYEFVARPALSMPTTPATKSFGGIKVGDDLTYEKKHVRASLGSASGSLKKLLGTTTGVM